MANPNLYSLAPLGSDAVGDMIVEVLEDEDDIQQVKKKDQPNGSSWMEKEEL